MLGTAVGIALASTFVAGHTIFQELYVDGVSAGHLEGIRVPDYDGVCPNSWLDSPFSVLTNFGICPHSLSRTLTPTVCRTLAHFDAIQRVLMNCVLVTG
jgi:hypothetical protein